MYAASKTKQPHWYHASDGMTMSTKRKYRDDGDMSRPATLEDSGDVNRYMDDTGSTSTGAYDTRHRESDKSREDGNRRVLDGSSMCNVKVKLEPEISDYYESEIPPGNIEFYNPQDHVAVQTNRVPVVPDIMSIPRDPIPCPITEHQSDQSQSIPLGPFPCPICGKLFKWKGDLPRHMQIHTGNKPFCCNICTKSFSRSHDLQRHVQLLHGDANPVAW
jgi:uncharacterized C2H2 Zn-finger protein